MGYESRIYIVEKSSLKYEDKPRYAQVIAMFDMCKMGSLVGVFKKKTDCYFYADDGDTKVLEDRYGDPLTEATIEDFLHALEEVVSGDNYRRFFPLLVTLKTIHKQQKDGVWKDVVLLHYGY